VIPLHLRALTLGAALILAASPAIADSGAVRVATLLPCAERALAEAGEHALVVASVKPSRHATLAEGVVDLGNPHSPSAELLHASGAELLVVDRAMHTAIAPKLARGGIEVLAVDTVARTASGATS